MRVLICGDRNWTDRAAIGRDVLTLPKGSMVIHGNARGADRSAGEIAHAHSLEDRRPELRTARHES
jgi:YspA, cpYpsA-related SLOG family